jgi:hypothetical protein
MKPCVGRCGPPPDGRPHSTQSEHRSRQTSGGYRRRRRQGLRRVYLTALCYFNALRELSGARRIVEDEVRSKLASYGTERRRLAPTDQPFANRRLRDVLELTSRENTDKVAAAKEALAKPCSDPAHGVDVALATNMISVGLDIGRLGLMLVQGQPKAAAEYIQATRRVGRLADKPGLVLALLNAHRPPRTRNESFGRGGIRDDRRRGGLLR